MSVTLSNPTSALSGKEITVTTGTHTITGAWTFDRDPSAPFAVTSGSAVVTNLDADKLDGLDSTAFPLAASGTLTSPTINTSLKSTTMFGGLTQGRLTLTSGTPVTTADVTGAVTIYFTPYKGNLLALYNGSTTWTVYPFTEISLAVGTLTNDLPYDVFVYDNAGTPTLEFLAWTNKTTRATALTTQNGVLVKTGATTRKYLGSFHTTATTTTEDSAAKRLLWNNYNRVSRVIKKFETTATWASSGVVFRQLNGSTANQVAFVTGVAEDILDVVGLVTAYSSVNTIQGVGIGEASTTVPSVDAVGGSPQSLGADYLTSYCRLAKVPAVGYTFWTCLESMSNAATVVGVTQTTNTSIQSGLTGIIRN